MEAPSHLYGEIDDMELDTFQVRVRERHELGGFDSSTELRSIVDEVSRKELNHRRTRAYADDMSTIFDFYDRFRRLIVHAPEELSEDAAFPILKLFIIPHISAKKASLARQSIMAAADFFSVHWSDRFFSVASDTIAALVEQLGGGGAKAKKAAAQLALEDIVSTLPARVSLPALAKYGMKHRHTGVQTESAKLTLCCLKKLVAVENDSHSKENTNENVSRAAEMVAMLPILLPVLGLGLAARSAATKSASRSSTQLLRACIGSAAFVEALDKTRKIDKKEIKVALLDASYTSPEKARLILFSSARASTKVHSSDEKRQNLRLQAENEPSCSAIIHRTREQSNDKAKSSHSDAFSTNMDTTALATTDTQEEITQPAKALNQCVLATGNGDKEFTAREKNGGRPPMNYSDDTEENETARLGKDVVRGRTRTRKPSNRTRRPKSCSAKPTMSKLGLVSQTTNVSQLNSSVKYQRRAESAHSLKSSQSLSLDMQSNTQSSYADIVGASNRSTKPANMTSMDRASAALLEYHRYSEKKKKDQKTLSAYVPSYADLLSNPAGIRAACAASRDRGLQDDTFDENRETFASSNFEMPASKSWLKNEDLQDASCQYGQSQKKEPLSAISRAATMGKSSGVKLKRRSPRTVFGDTINKDSFDLLEQDQEVERDRDAEEEKEVLISEVVNEDSQVNSIAREFEIEANFKKIDKLDITRSLSSMELIHSAQLMSPANWLTRCRASTSRKPEDNANFDDFQEPSSDIEYKSNTEADHDNLILPQENISQEQDLEHASSALKPQAYIQAVEDCLSSASILIEPISTFSTHPRTWAELAALSDPYLLHGLPATSSSELVTHPPPMRSTASINRLNSNEDRCYHSHLPLSQQHKNCSANDNSSERSVQIRGEELEIISTQIQVRGTEEEEEEDTVMISNGSLGVCIKNDMLIENNDTVEGTGSTDSKKDYQSIRESPPELPVTLAHNDPVGACRGYETLSEENIMQTAPMQSENKHIEEGEDKVGPHVSGDSRVIQDNIATMIFQEFDDIVESIECNEHASQPQEKVCGLVELNLVKEHDQLTDEESTITEGENHGHNQCIKKSLADVPHESLISKDLHAVIGIEKVATETSTFIAISNTPLSFEVTGAEEVLGGQESKEKQGTANICLRQRFQACVRCQSECRSPRESSSAPWLLERSSSEVRVESNSGTIVKGGSSVVLFKPTPRGRRRIKHLHSSAAQEYTSIRGRSRTRRHARNDRKKDERKNENTSIDTLSERNASPPSDPETKINTQVNGGAPMWRSIRDTTLPSMSDGEDNKRDVDNSTENQSNDAPKVVFEDNKNDATSNEPSEDSEDGKDADLEFGRRKEKVTVTQRCLCLPRPWGVRKGY